MLIPGYLFVVTNQPERLAEALWKVPAFIRLLGNDEVFTPLSDAEADFANVFKEPRRRVVRMSQGIAEGDEIVV